MRRCLLAVVTLLVGVVSSPRAETPCAYTTTILLVRHAERPSGVDTLNAEGYARAEVLAHVGEKSGVSAIYHSDTVRTRLTAAPLAALLNLVPTVHPAQDSVGLARSLLANHCGETVLVVGHSNTLNQIIQAAGGATLPDLDESEFDTLYILEVRDRDRSLLHLQYGAPSPAE
jgi:broad specificity phosphatase PhoE